MSELGIAAGATAETDDVCDYIIVRLTEAGSYINILKLQKLAYYIQAWSNAFYGRRCFNSSFEAWVHGPVSVSLYRRFKDTKSLYSSVTMADVRPTYNSAYIPASVKHHINSILEAYAAFSDDQLEEMTHLEEPWLQARKGYQPHERCQVDISDTLMASYYSERVKGTKA